jgi:GTP-binding protein
MEVKQAVFVSSHSSVSKCPPPDKPEFAFIGRSNVGKSSLINMLTNRKGLAKTSAAPGKTQTINHFLVNESWYLVDLPGYGYASVSKQLKKGWSKMIEDYLLQRTTLACLFVLIDSRLAPQPNDLSFLTWAGEKELPLCLVFTKADKLSRNELTHNLNKYNSELMKLWDPLPPRLVTSSTSHAGREELLAFIDEALSAYHNLS